MSLPANAADHAHILETVGIAVVTIDNGGTLLEVNEAAVDMFGFKRAAMLGRNVSMLMPQRHARVHDDYLRHYLETGVERIIGSGRKVEGRRADGHLFPMHLAVGRHIADGEVFFTGIIHDLSEPERDVAEATRLGRIVEESINEIYVFDALTLCFTIINASAAANLGYSIDELRAMTPLDIKPSFDRTQFEELLEPLRKGAVDRRRFETVHRRKDGSQYDAEIVLHLSDAVSPPEFVAIVTDVTEHNRMLDALRHAQKMDAIGQLTGGVAHDFNNLLTVIGGNLELLALESLPGEGNAHELLSEAREAVRMGAGLIGRLLSFARRSNLSPETLDLNERILEVSELLRRTLGEAISFELSLAPRLWPVRIDVSLLENALINLALNARDAMAGRGRLDIATANCRLDGARAAPLDLAAGDYVTLSVTDDGPGIDAADAEHVFEPFFTTKSGSRGHGLGLSMVYGFARQSGGHVELTSRVGEGACFTLYLARVEASSLASKTTPTVVSAEVPIRRRILVVEDDAQVRRLTVRRLRHVGQDTIDAPDGPTALAAFHADPDIDALLTDMVMPNGLSGLELAREVRQQRPALPVLIVSGYSEELLPTEVLRDKKVRLLRKPYDSVELIAALQALFDE